MARYVLDTNIISAMLRQEEVAMTRLAEALATNTQLLLCPMVYYEVYRGLLHRDAKKKMGFFTNSLTIFTWDDFTQADWLAASQLWARLRGSGYHVAENDLLIGVFAHQREAIVVTDNEKDFAQLGVSVENWRR